MGLSIIDTKTDIMKQGLDIFYIIYFVLPCAECTSRVAEFRRVEVSRAIYRGGPVISILSCIIVHLADHKHSFQSKQTMTWQGSTDISYIIVCRVWAAKHDLATMLTGAFTAIRVLDRCSVCQLQWHYVFLVHCEPCGDTELIMGTRTRVASSLQAAI